MATTPVSVRLDEPLKARVRSLADQRRLPAEMLASNEFADRALAEVLFDAYCNGFMWTGEDE